MTAPNPLYQEGYSMTDTTDQQAVTVAQEDRDAAALLVPLCFGASKQWQENVRAGFYDDGEIVQAFARHRLASVSSASAGYVLVPREPTEAMVNACQDNLYSSNPSWNDPREIWSAMLAASPEPAPATNQAGEVDVRVRLREAYDAVADWPEKRGDPMTVGGAGFMDLLKLRNLVAELLDATQPPTSQEGDGTLANPSTFGKPTFGFDDGEPVPATNQADAYHDFPTCIPATQPATSQPEEAWMNDPRSLDAGLPATSQEKEIPGGMKAWFGGNGPPEDWDGGLVFRRALGLVEQPETEDPAFEWLHHPHGRLHDLDIIAYTPKALAVTPTPPTLSEDLREALSDMLEAFTNSECGEVDRRLAVETARAALAQVKAS